MGEVLEFEFNKRSHHHNAVNDNESGQYLFGKLAQEIISCLDVSQQRFSKFSSFLSALKVLDNSNRYSVTQTPYRSEDMHRYLLTINEDTDICFEILISRHNVLITNFMEEDFNILDKGKHLSISSETIHTNSDDAFHEIKNLIEDYEPSFSTDSVRILTQALKIKEIAQMQAITTYTPD